MPASLPDNIEIVRPRDLPELLNLEYRAHNSVLLWGWPGIGKSAIARQFSDSIGALYFDTRLGQKRDVDLSGTPWPDPTTRTTVWFHPDEFPTKNVPTVWCFDEVNRTRQDTQNAALQLILPPHTLGAYTAPPEVWIMACANPDGSRGVTPLNEALCNRFAHYYLQPNVQDWTEWAYDNLSFDTAVVIAFLNAFPAALNEPDPGGKSHAYPTPRSWHALANSLDQNPSPGLLPAVVASKVGRGRGGEFLAYKRAYDARQGYNLDAALDDPTSYKIPPQEEPGTRYAVAAGISGKMDFKTLAPALTYLERFPREYSAFAVNLAIRRDDRLTQTREYGIWKSRHN